METQQNTQTVDLVTPENRRAFDEYLQRLQRHIGKAAQDADQYASHSDALLVDVEVLQDIDHE